MTRFIGIGLAAIVWGLLTFMVGLRVHFPDDTLIQYLQWQVQEGSEGGFALEAKTATPWRLTGVVLKDATLYSVQKAPRRSTPLRSRRRAKTDEGDIPEEDAEAAAEPPPQGTVFLRSERVAVRMEPLSLLMGTRAARFQTDLYGGDLSGRVAMGSETTDIDATLGGIDLALIPIQGDGWMADLAGELKLDVDLALGGEKGKDSSGTVELRIEQLIVNSIEMMGFTLDEPTAFTEALLRMEAKNGKLEITEGRFTSEPVEIELGGYVQLARELSRVRLRLDLRIKLSDALDGMAKNLPQMKTARDKEGVYHFIVSGTPEAPQFREDPVVRRSNIGPSETRRRIEDRLRSEEEGLSDEEKLRAREERLERMQERMRAGNTTDGGDPVEPGGPGERLRVPGRGGIRPPGPDGDFGPGRPDPIRPNEEPPFPDEEPPFPDEEPPFPDEEDPLPDEEEEVYEDEE